MTPFIIHAVQGVVRDQNTRRRAMFMLLVVALGLLFSGTTFLQTTLSPHEHPTWFILFWTACGWLTLTALVLAIFDLLMVRIEARKAERIFRVEFSQRQTSGSSESKTDE